VQRELGAVLRRIAEGGADGFYRGETADLIVREMKTSGGLITHADLAAYQAKERVPIEGTFRGWRVVSMPPPSSGGVALLQLLGLAERRGLAPLGFQSMNYIHSVCEMEKRVFADRAEFLGDPDFVAVPTARLTGSARLDRMAGKLGRARTDPATVKAESEETTHFSVVDRRGNAVSNTTTLNGNYGCGIVIRGAGFLMNNEMDDFSAKPGAPNMFGATGGAANAIAPGKRMLSSMTPTFAFKDGRLRLVLGTPGGTTIFTTVFQVLVNRIEFDMTLEEAVNAPRFHHQWPPLRRDEDVVWFEQVPPADAELRQLGYTVKPRGRIGDVHAIEIDGPRPKPVSDRRGIGLALTE
jgi:gamma-glutamyltranspeptidase/glutathione hydrolase